MSTVSKVIADHFDNFYKECLVPLEPLYHELPREHPLHKACWFLFHQFAHMGSRVINLVKFAETGDDLGTFWNFLGDGGGDALQKYLDTHEGRREYYMKKCEKLEKLLDRNGIDHSKSTLENL